MMSLSFLLAGWCVLPSSTTTPPECQATRQPHSPVRCLVELVRAEATKGGRHHEYPIRARDGLPDPGLSAIMSERGQLVNLAYRLLGSLAEVPCRRPTPAGTPCPGHRGSHSIPGGWLTKVASRICLDLLGSARARWERYVRGWITEPLPNLPSG
jgi:hypothetical protein